MNSSECLSKNYVVRLTFHKLLISCLLIKSFVIRVDVTGQYATGTARIHNDATNESFPTASAIKKTINRPRVAGNWIRKTIGAVDRCVIRT